MVNSKSRFYSSAHVGRLGGRTPAPAGVAWGQTDSPVGNPTHEFLPFSRDLGDRCRSRRLLMRMIAGAHQRPRLDVPETEPQCFLFHLAKLGRRVEARNRQVIF